MSLHSSNSLSFEYYLVSAFSNRPFGGNPAVVAFLDPNETSENILAGVAATFKQPMTAFLSNEPSSGADVTVKRFSVRYFTAEREASLCIHATLAAAKTIFQTAQLGEEVKLLEFVTKTHGVVTARKVSDNPESWIEVELIKGDIAEVADAEKKRITDIVNEAFGKPLIQHEIGKETGYSINAITAKSTTGNDHFASRVFVPFDSLGGEDHVCGSAHALLGPYWATKQAISDGEEIRAIHVGRRGGDLRIFLVHGQPKLRIRGEATTIARGIFSF
ncbi:hypothetical protein GG344DRAFT_77858 [Lentinula edodes]|nr:hypothetical protein GG344DRAFT_77858 [Lentinula edodes]